MVQRGSAVGNFLDFHKRKQNHDAPMKRFLLISVSIWSLFPLVSAVAQSGSTLSPKKEEAVEFQACAGAALQGFRRGHRRYY